MPDAPSFAPTTILALLPAAYAWQVHGRVAAAAVFCLTGGAVIGLGWASVMREWPPRRLTLARTILIIGVMVLVALSAVEIRHL